jgi:uncharacterized protein YcfL
MNHRLLVLALSAATLAMAGCVKVSETARSTGETVYTGHPGGAYRPVNTDKYAIENTDRIALLDKHVEISVTCSGLQERFLDDGRLEIFANLRNREERRIEVQVRCVFKDSQGFSSGDETPYNTVILTENGQETVHFVSMNNLAKRYTIQIREAH